MLQQNYLIFYVLIETIETHPIKILQSVFGYVNLTR